MVRGWWFRIPLVFKIFLNLNIYTFLLCFFLCINTLKRFTLSSLRYQEGRIAVSNFIYNFIFAAFNSHWRAAMAEQQTTLSRLIRNWFLSSGRYGQKVLKNYTSWWDLHFSHDEKRLPIWKTLPTEKYWHWSCRQRRFFDVNEPLVNQSGKTRLTRFLTKGSWRLPVLSEISQVLKISPKLSSDNALNSEKKNAYE